MKMKKHLHSSLKALFLSLAVLVSLPMMAEKVEIDGIWYNLESDGKQAEVTYKGSYYDEYNEYFGVVVIPASVVYNGTAYSVTSIGNFAFGLCSGLTSVTIPNSVTSIGEYAFYVCFGLTSVTIPNSVTSIGNRAFENCERLTSVTIGSGVTSIGNEAFRLCSGLTSVHISDIAAWCNILFYDGEANPLYYAKHLYFNAEEVKDLVIPNSVTSIGNYAFDACIGLTSVTIPNSVTSIGHCAFCKCSGLTSVRIGNSVENIGFQAFAYCSGLTSVTIPNSVTSIGASAFHGCSGLTSVIIPNSVTSIDDLAFAYCPGLTSVTIGSGVKNIPPYSFAYCQELLDVYCYAEQVPSTYSNAFDGSYPGNVTLHVPAGSLESYKTTAPWSDFGNIVALSNQYQLTVSSVGYATLFLDYNAEIPVGVEAYVASEVVDGRLKMQAVEGVLPANTGVIIKADAGTYAFVESDEVPAIIEKNLLMGSAENTYVTAEANTSYYVLSAPGGVVGMYMAQLTGGKFLNNANKAYLLIRNADLGIYDDEVDSGVEQLSRRLVFDFGDDETGIDEVKTENGELKTAVYALSGRRVQSAQKGIYIQNGKVVVK